MLIVFLNEITFKIWYTIDKLPKGDDQMKLSEELKWRGYLNQTTIKDITDLDTKTFSFYLGCDPSSDSLTIGNLASMMIVRHFIDHGHKAFLLVGGATGMIGDPDGKADERNLKTIEEINHNKACIAKQYDQVMAGQPFTVVDNYDWFKDMNYLKFLREVGKYAPMGQMLSREFVQSRLGEDGSGISYAEFSYSLIQGYDFLHLFRNFGVNLQLCGADQWGNSVTGVDLIRRIENKEAHVLSGQLIINKSTGKKFGKTEEGAVWLDSKKTSVFKFYQFWLNLDDEGVIDYIKIYTLLDESAISDLEQKTKENPNLRLAQKTLAEEVTKIVHGKERTESVKRVTEVLFGGADFALLNDEDITALSNEIPTVNLGKTVIEALVETNLASSNGEARRLIDGGAISVNDKKIDSDTKVDAPSLIKKGKNSFILVK